MYVYSYEIYVSGRIFHSFLSSYGPHFRKIGRKEEKMTKTYSDDKMIVKNYHYRRIQNKEQL